MQIDYKACIKEKKDWGSYHLLSILSPEIAPQVKPGQFIMVRTSPLTYPLLRRPFSVHFAEGDTLEIFFQESGVGTSLLSRVKEGDHLDILGPLGRGFSLNSEDKKGDIAVIGGGRGIAPLYLLALKLKEQGSSIRIFYGGRTEADLPLLDKFKEKNLSIFGSTDNGSLGYHGFITELFVEKCKEHDFQKIFACGPEPMLQTIAQIAEDQNISAEVSLESIMGCGFGACWGCVKRIKKGSQDEWRKICEDGPVFPAQDIIWERGSE
jgi:dihydroorotate dehydrogenase electron transfer subunit